MRVSLTEDEEKAILDEAFALIDACDGFTSEAGSSSSSSESAEAEVARRCSRRTEDRGTEATGKKASSVKKKRIRRPETSSTAFQRRKKAEIMALRDEVAALETRMGNLKQRHREMWERHLKVKDNAGHAQEAGQPEESTWCDQAVKQYRRRLASEKRNRQLKEILKHQFKVDRDLHAVVQRRDALFVRTRCLCWLGGSVCAALTWLVVVSSFRECKLYSLTKQIPIVKPTLPAILMKVEEISELAGWPVATPAPPLSSKAPRDSSLASFCLGC
jgi:hypothetical protein